MGEPTTARLTSMHFYAWKRGLKTGMYYLRSLPKADAIQFTVDQAALTTSRANTISNTTNINSKHSSSTATKGLDYEAEQECENCSA